MTYQYVSGNADALATITEEFQVKQILHWASFTATGQKNAIYNDSIQDYKDLLNISEKDVTNLAKDYSSCATAARINFGQRRIKQSQGHHPLGDRSLPYVYYAQYIGCEWHAF